MNEMLLSSNFLHDVSYGTKKITFSSGRHVRLPAIVQGGPTGFDTRDCITQPSNFMMMFLK